VINWIEYHERLNRYYEICIANPEFNAIEAWNLSKESN